MRVLVRNHLGRKQGLFLSFGNKFKLRRERARRLRQPGAQEAFADKEVEEVSVASKEAGFGPGLRVSNNSHDEPFLLLRQKARLRPELSPKFCKAQKPKIKPLLPMSPK